MAIYPYGTYRPLTVPNNDPPIIPIGAILHVAASTSKSLYGFFNGPSNGIESHFFVRWDGHTEQYRTTGQEADANLKANSFIGSDGKRYGYISIETQGLEPDRWTDAQITELKRLLTWLSETHRFPLERCPEHTKPGVGYHVMFGAPGPWTPVSKSCPGPARILQFNNILVPWMNAQAQTPKPEELPLSVAEDILAEVKATRNELKFFAGLSGQRWAQEVNEAREATAALKALLEAAATDDEADDVAAAGRYAQIVNEGREQAAAILAKLELVTPPKA